MQLGLEGFDVLVTGGAGGIGAASACVCRSVANAGGFDRTPTPIWESSLERFRAGIEANLVATWLTCRAFLRHVRETGEGSLVLVGSTAGIFGEAGHAEYASAKSAINLGLARTLKNEIVRLAPRGRVNVVAPGWTATPTAAWALDDETVEHSTRTYALRKVATPEDVASAIVWVASPAAGHTTGEIIPVSGGMEGRVIW